MIKPEDFVRKPFYIKALRVTDVNLEEVAEWCGGEVQVFEEDTPENEPPRYVKFVKVKVHRPLNERQTRAQIGDWILQAGSGFKVYTDRAFHNSFEPIKISALNDELLREKAVHEKETQDA